MPDWCGNCGRKLRGKGVCGHCNPGGNRGYDIVDVYKDSSGRTVGTHKYPRRKGKRSVASDVMNFRWFA